MDLLPDSFRNAHLWPLFLTAFLPLLLHLLDRRRAPRVSWPAMRFLPARDPRLMRRVRTREVLLIASRTAALVFIALAFLQPFASSGPPGAPGSVARRGAVLVLDTSPSMGYRASSDGPSSLEVARAAAFRLLEELGPDAPVGVVLGSDGKGGDPGGRRDEDRDDGSTAGPAAIARAAVARARPGGAPFSLERALDRALERARLMSPPAREIRIFTDLQRGTLEEDDGRLKLLAARLESFSPRPRLTLVDCGAGAAENRAVHPGDPPALIAGIDEPVALRFIVSTSGRPQGTDETERFAFRLLVDDRAVEERRLPPSPRPQELLLEHRFEAPGLRRIRGEIETDGLRADDTARMALDVRDRLDVLIVESSRGGEGKYLEKALWPRPPGHPPPPTILRVRSRPATSLEERDLEATDVVIAPGLPRPRAEDARLLEDHLRRGKGLIVFAGPALDGEAWTRHLFRAGLGPLPARIDDHIPGTGSARRPEAIDTTHPLLLPFSKPEEGDLRLIEVSSHRRTGTVAREARVLARIEGGDPWILERPFEGGRVVLVTTSAAPDDSDLPLTPLFPPLVHRLVRYAAAGIAEPRPAETGELIEHLLSPGADPSSVSVVDPEGARHPAEVTHRNGRPTAVFRETRSPGFYRFEVADGAAAASDPELPALRAVNIPREESVLERIDEPRLSSLVDLLGAELLPRSETEAPRPRVTGSREYWPHAAAIALTALLGELFLVASIARRQPAGQGMARRRESPGVASFGEVNA